MDLEKLKEPFPPDRLEWRVQASGNGERGPWVRVMPFIDARCIMERLDAVCGIGNWQNQYAKGPDGGVMCGISIRIGEEWVTKWDGAETPEEQESGARNQESGERQKTHVDPVKTSLTNAFKRAAVQWGIGRYLYDILAGYADICDGGKYQVKIQGKMYRWNPPGKRQPEARSQKPEGEDKNEQGGTMRGDVHRAKIERARKEIWEWCLELANGDVEEAKKILKRHAGFDEIGRLFETVILRVHPKIKAEYEAKKKI